MKWIEHSRAIAVAHSSGPPVMKASSSSAIASCTLRAPAPETIPTLRISAGTVEEGERLTAGQHLQPRDERCGRDRLAGHAAAHADLAAVVGRKWLATLEVQPGRDQRVVAHDGVGVEREMVGGEADVRAQQQGQTLDAPDQTRRSSPSQNRPWWVMISCARASIARWKISTFADTAVATEVT